MTSPLPIVTTVLPPTTATRDAGTGRSDTGDNPAFSQILAEQRSAQKGALPPPATAARSGSSASQDSSLQDDLLEEANTAEQDFAIEVVPESVQVALLPPVLEGVVETTLQQIQMSHLSVQSSADALTEEAKLLAAPPTENASAIALPAQATGPAAAVVQEAETHTPTAVSPQRTPTATAMTMVKNRSESDISLNLSTSRVGGEQKQAGAESSTADEAAHLTALPALTAVRQLQTPAAQPSDTSAINDIPSPAQIPAMAAMSPSLAQPAAQPPAALVDAPAYQLQSKVGSTQWGNQLGQQLILMSHDAQRGTQRAELRLDPPEIGPLRVTLSLNEGVAHASFFSAHAAVRQAVETALPQLQQALAQAGISLGNFNVGDHASAQESFAQQHSSSSRQQGDEQRAEGATEIAPAGVKVSRAPDAIIDTFA